MALARICTTWNGVPSIGYNMFKREENKKLCEEVLHEVAKRQGIEIIELSVMPDHIHTVVAFHR